MMRNDNDISVSFLSKERYIESGGNPRELLQNKPEVRPVFVHPDAF